MLINNILINYVAYRIKDPKATVIVTHGIAEHSMKYITFAEKLNEAGYDVVLYDLRGHGLSQGKRGYARSYRLYSEDLYQIVLEEKKYKKRKVYLFGHSLGGFITNLYAANHANYDAYISSSAPLDYMKNLNIFRYLGTWWLFGYKKRTNFYDERLMNQQEYQHDPLDLEFFYARPMIQLFTRGMRDFHRKKHKIKKPALFLYSKQDQLIDVESAIKTISHIQSRNKKVIEYEYSKHELFKDIEKEKVINDVIEWLNGL